MADSHKLSQEEIRIRIRELEEVKPKKIEEYTEREAKIYKLLALLY